MVVVVTAGWHVLCFDHNLKLLWDRSIRVRPVLDVVLHRHELMLPALLSLSLQTSASIMLVF